MGILQQAARRKKGRRMGEPRVVSRDEVEEMGLGARGFFPGADAAVQTAR